MRKAYLVLKGGLGNQLFQAAFGLVLERLTGAEIVYALDSYRPDEPFGRAFLLHRYFPKLRRFAVTHAPSGPMATFTEPFSMAEPAKVLADVVRFVSEHTETVVDGYWICEQYQADLLNLMRDHFSFGDLSDEVRREGESLRAADHIGIHVRRADYGHHGLARVKFYKDCLAAIRQEKGDLPAVVFTDEYNFCSYEFRTETNVRVVRGDPAAPIDDFYRLTCCKHFILSNSSFAIWAANLAETTGSVVYIPVPYCVFLPHLTPPRRWRHVQDATQPQ